MEVGLVPGQIVLDEDPAALPTKGSRAPNFRPTSVVAKRLYVSGYHLVGSRPQLGDIVLDGDPVSLPEWDIAPNFRPMSVVAKWLDGLRCHLV